MKEETKELFDKLRQTLPNVDEQAMEFTCYDPIGVQIYDALMNLNMLEVELHDVITKNVFKDIDYYSIVSLFPLWTRNDGHSQEGCFSKEQFESLLSNNNNESLDRNKE